MMKKQAQLKLVDRTKLQAYLEDEIPVKIICKKLGVSKQTIYREIHRNSIYKNPDIPYRVKCVNDPRKCIHKKPGCRCTRECKYFIQQQCKKVIRFPFVCNKCSNKIGCILPKRYYFADKAQGSNNKIKVIKRVSYGYSDFYHLRNRIMYIFNDDEKPLSFPLKLNKIKDTKKLFYKPRKKYEKRSNS